MLDQNLIKGNTFLLSNLVDERKDFMSLEELLSIERYSYIYVHEFVVSKGLRNITSEDLDKIIDKFGSDAVGTVDFFNLYNIVSTNEANKQMAKWTWITMICTVVVTIATIYNVFFQN